ncbi:Pectinesterase protein, partial [Dioscorea alata]
MRSSIITLVVAALLVCISAGRHTPADTPATDFIKSSCRSTTYPELCVECLSAYAPALHRNPRQLAHAALSAGAIRDCFETMSDSLDQLRKSMKEMGKMSKSNDKRGFEWHLSNLQTWVSAALTDQSTCMDGLAEDGRRSSRVRASIRKKVLDVAHVTSNALALINKIKP